MRKEIRKVVHQYKDLNLKYKAIYNCTIKMIKTMKKQKREERSK